MGEYSSRLGKALLSEFQGVHIQFEDYFIHLLLNAEISQKTTLLYENHNREHQIYIKIYLYVFQTFFMLFILYSPDITE